MSKSPMTKSVNSTKDAASKAEGSKAAASIKMTSTQKLGVSVLTALNSALDNPPISVGTTQNTIILNGTVKNDKERQRPGLIARQAGPKCKVINQLKVTAKPKKNAAPPKPAKTG